jgi:hypothetical protein
MQILVCEITWNLEGPPKGVAGWGCWGIGDEEATVTSGCPCWIEREMSTSPDCNLLIRASPTDLGNIIPPKCRGKLVPQECCTLPQHCNTVKGRSTNRLSSTAQLKKESHYFMYSSVKFNLNSV